MESAVGVVDDRNRPRPRDPSSRLAMLVGLNRGGAAQATQHQHRSVFQHFDDHTAFAGAHDLPADTGAQTFDGDGHHGHRKRGCVQGE